MASELSKLDLLLLAANSIDRPLYMCSRQVRDLSYEKDCMDVELVNDTCTLSCVDDPTESKRYTLDFMKRNYPAFLREVVSFAEWRSYCDVDRQCRICQLPDELCIRDSVEPQPADIAVASLSDAKPAETTDIPLLRHTPTPEPELVVYSASPSPPPQPRCLSVPSDDSMDVISTTSSYSPSPPPPHRTPKKSTKSSKVSQTRSRRTNTARLHTEYDKTILAASEIKTIENSPVLGPAKTLHEAIFDYITPRPSDRWIAIIALLTNRQFKQVSCWFMNRRCKLEGKLLEESDPKWRSYYQNTNFKFPDGSIVAMRASALQRWSSCQWTDDDFKRVVQEDFIPNLDVLEVKNQRKRQTVPWYGHAKKRFPPDGRVKASDVVSGKKRQRRKARTRRP